MINMEFKELVIEGKEFVNLDYKNKTLEEVEFYGTKFEKVDFSGCMFQDVEFNDIDATEVDFSKCKMESDQLEFRGKFKKCNFKDSEVNYIEIRYSEIENNNFQNFISKYSSFSSCNLKNNDMSGAVLYEFGIWGKVLMNNKFNNAKFDCGGFHSLKCESNDFTGATFEGYSWYKSTCKKEILKNSIITYACNDRASYLECDFENVKIIKTDFDACEFIDDNLKNAEMYVFI